MVRKIGVPECYKEFRCIDVECSDSCCAGWQVDVDQESWNYYKSVTGEFGDYLHSVMIDLPKEECEDAGQFCLREDGRCPFLNDAGLCDMYTNLGEDKLCKTCTNFPRFMEDYGDLREVGIAFSCPEAARLMLSKTEPMAFMEVTIGEEKDQEEKKVAEDIMWRTKGMGISEEPVAMDGFVIEPEPFDQEYCDQLYACRKTAYELMKMRSFSIEERASLYLDFCVTLQNALDHEQTELWETICESFEDEKFISQRLQQLKEAVASHEDYDLYGDAVPVGKVRYSFVPEYGAVLYQELKHCKPQWGPLLEDAEEELHKAMGAESYGKCYSDFVAYYEDKEYEYEHLMMYFIFKYFLKSYFDDDIYGKGQLAVMGLIMVRELGMAQWKKQGECYETANQAELFHLYSREMEHSEENYDAFVDSLKMENMCNYEHLLGVLLER